MFLRLTYSKDPKSHNHRHLEFEILTVSNQEFPPENVCESCSNPRHLIMGTVPEEDLGIHEVRCFQLLYQFEVVASVLVHELLKPVSKSHERSVTMCQNTIYIRTQKSQKTLEV